MGKKIILLLVFFITSLFVKAQIKAYEYSSNSFNEAKIIEILEQSKKSGTPDWEIQKLKDHLYNRLEKQKQRLSTTSNVEKFGPPPTPMIACQPSCSNIGFESGNTNGWTLTSGDINGVNLPCNTCATNAGAITALTTASNSGGMWTNGVDDCSQQSAVAPGGGVYSICINNTTSGGKMQEIQQAFNVTATNNVLTYQYLAILEQPNPPHLVNQQPYFFSQVLDASNNSIPCTYYLQAADAAAVGWVNCSATGGCPDAQFKGWVTVTLDLTAYIGQCVTVQFVASDCNQGGHYGYAYIDASCDQIQVDNTITVCPPSAQLCAPLGFNTYSWSGPVTGNTACLPGATAGNYTVVTTGQCPSPTLHYTVTVSPTPTVNFSSTVTPCNNTVVFADQTTISGGATIASYSWTFGDGGTSTLPNPSHPYATTGTFNVALTCTSSVGCVGTFSSSITLATGPSAVFSASTVCPGNPTAFTNTSTGATGYSWDFGEPASGAANTSTATNPTHTYAGPGNYTAVLSATGTGTCVSTKSVTVVVSPIPTATISSTPVCLGAATVFTSTINPTAGSTYMWNYGDGPPAAGTATPSHTYATANTFPVTVTVTAAGGCTVTATTNALVNPVPTAIFTVAPVCQGTGSSFNGSASTTGATYNWNFGGAGAGSNITTATPTYTYSAAGTFPVTLLVTVGTCTATTTSNAVVDPMPVLSFNTVPACDQSPVIINNTTASQGTFTVWAWNFGGSPAGTSISAAPGSYTYPAPGIYTVTLTGTTATGCSGTVTATSTVHPNPIADGGVSPACLGDATQFVDFSTVTNPPGISDAVTGWNWSFGDASTSPSPAPTHTYATCGVYSISITATTNFNCTNTLSGTDTVFCLPHVVAPPSFSVCPGTSVTSAKTTFTTTCAAPAWGIPITIYFANNPNPTTNISTTHGGIPLADTSGFNSIPTYPAINPNTTCGLLVDTIYGFAVTVVSNSLACIGDAATFTISVYPTPTVSPVNSVTVCANVTVPAVNFTGCPIATETFSWTATGANVGITSTSPGNIASFPGQNTTDMPAISTVSVTPLANGCVGPGTTYNITVNPIPVLTVTSPTPYCPGDIISSTTNGYNVNTDPVGTVTYTWTATNQAGTGMPAGGTGDAPNTAYPAPANPSQVNQYSIITYTPSLAGCIGLPVTETVTVKPTPTMVAMTDQFWCPGSMTDAVPLSTNPASAASTYAWSSNAPPIGASGSANPIPSFGPTQNLGLTTLGIAVTVTPTLNGCVGPPSGFNISVYPNPIAKFSATDRVCDGFPMGFMDLSKPNTGSITVNQWAWDMNSDGAIDMSTQNPTYTYPLGSTGTNSVTLYIGTSSAPSCTAQVTEPVYINPIPVADFVGDSLKSCPKLLTNFTNLTTVLTPTTGISYVWTFGNGNTSTSATPTQQTYTNGSATQSAYYNVTLTATTDSGCVNTKTKVKYIEVYPRPIANFSWGPTDADIDEPNIIFTNEAPGVGTYTAAPLTYGPNGVQYYLDDIYAPNPNVNTHYGNSYIGDQFSHTYEHYDTATYYVTQWVINKFGCKDEITKPVHIGPNFTFYIPNAFSPNGDGTNEGFKGLGVGIDNTTYNLWVFDRWGLMIFYADDIDKSWDGHMHGNEGKPVLQEDVYVWKVKFNDFTGKKHEFHGTVTLLK